MTANSTAHWSSVPQLVAFTCEPCGAGSGWPGTGLVASSPCGPADSVGGCVDGLGDERREQVLDLVAERDQVVRDRSVRAFVGVAAARKAWAGIDS